MYDTNEATEQVALIKKVIKGWLRHPDTFVTDAFGIKPDPWQVEALEALFGHGRVAIRACHGPGKTALAAWAILLFLLSHFPARIPCTAPTASQLRDVLWSELGKWLNRLKDRQPGLRGMFRLTTERLELVNEPEEAFAVARTARPEAPEALQGFHNENMLFVIDEASGVHQAIFEVGEGALSEEGAKVLMLGNPTRTSGYFFDAFHRVRARWYCIKVAAEDSPRVSDSYVEDMAAKYGAESNVYRVRVLGEFPTAADNAVISLEDAESAVGREIAQFGDVAWGVDVARFGDDRSALAKTTQNALIEPIKWWGHRSTMETAGIVVAEYDATPEPELPTAIYVDVIGLGAGVVDRLLERGLPAVGVNVAESPSNKPQYMRLRDELWWEARQWLEGRDVTIARQELAEVDPSRAYNIASTGELIAELTLPTYAMHSSGKIQIESKDQIKKRLGQNGQSPDLADAFILTRYHRFSAVRRVHARTYRREGVRASRQGGGRGRKGIV